jgi:hypothetical protein
MKRHLVVASWTEQIPMTQLDSRHRRDQLHVALNAIMPVAAWISPPALWVPHVLCSEPS